MSNNNNALHPDCTARSQWPSFSGRNLLKTDLSVCEIDPSYLLELSTVLKYTEVRVMGANNCSLSQLKILTSCLILQEHH